MSASHSDPVEEAHLAYIRGEKQVARDLLDELLLADPTNAEAIALRDQVERDMVEDASIAHEREEAELFNEV